MSGTSDIDGTSDTGDPTYMRELRQLRNQFTRFMMLYKFGIDELMTKINILDEEFAAIHSYSPIEHVQSRLKTPESVLAKAYRIECPPTLTDLRERIWDIAGIRITCSFISDAYRIADLLGAQPDVTVVQIKDYIANPKPNGYKSLHLIVDIPVFLSDSVEAVRVEIQIRTIAMDFWASLEHKIYYKFEKTVPQATLDELKQAADIANRLDVQMERLHDEVIRLGGHSDATSPTSADEKATQDDVTGRLFQALSKWQQTGPSQN